MARTLAIVFLILTLATGANAADQQAIELGRRYTADFQQGRLDALWERMTPQMQEALGGNPETLGQLRNAIAAQIGTEQTVLSEEMAEAEGHRVYLRTAAHAKDGPPVVTQFAFDGGDRIAGFYVRPQQQAAPSRFLDYQTKTSLRLPFDGEWHVYWGGRTPQQNYHAVDPGQRFAYDLNIVRDGASHAGDPRKQESYHCWDQPVLAPADATIVSTIDGLPDQEIGERDPRNPAGNHVVVDFGGDEYAFIAHLKQGSVNVQQGDEVVAGAEIGRCGNSGNSSEPHLHFHMQTTPELGEGEGLPAFLDNYVADGAVVKRGEPTRGQIIAPADAQ